MDRNRALQVIFGRKKRPKLKMSIWDPKQCITDLFSYSETGGELRQWSQLGEDRFAKRNCDRTEIRSENQEIWSAKISICNRLFPPRFWAITGAARDGRLPNSYEISIRYSPFNNNNPPSIKATLAEIQKKVEIIKATRARLRAKRARKIWTFLADTKGETLQNRSF